MKTFIIKKNQKHTYMLLLLKLTEVSKLKINNTTINFPIHNISPFLTVQVRSIFIPLLAYNNKDLNPIGSR